LFVVNLVILGIIGAKPVEYPFVEVGQLSSLFYFGFLFVYIPVSGKIESFLMRYKAL
jgi:ubiquinol-cytochrome c reductase cytochrome b subunit